MIKTWTDVPEVMSFREAAEILGISTYTVRKMVNSNSLSAIMVGGRQKIPKEILRNFVYAIAERR